MLARVIIIIIILFFCFGSCRFNNHNISFPQKIYLEIMKIKYSPISLKHNEPENTTPYISTRIVLGQFEEKTRMLNLLESQAFVRLSNMVITDEFLFLRFVNLHSRYKPMYSIVEKEFMKEVYAYQEVSTWDDVSNLLIDNDFSYYYIYKTRKNK